MESLYAVAGIATLLVGIIGIVVIGMHVYFDNKRCEADAEALINSVCSSFEKMFDRL